MLCLGHLTAAVIERFVFEVCEGDPPNEGLGCGQALALPGQKIANKPRRFLPQNYIQVSLTWKFDPIPIGLLDLLLKWAWTPFLGMHLQVLTEMRFVSCCRLWVMVQCLRH